ncbi:Chloroperoxidase [Mycena haematopus]|nr:Chloroperoxidase [Mycena haematopus]
MSLQATSEHRDYTFIPAGPSDKRSPCPALNALANHGYLPRNGTQITFTHLLHAIKAVYNLSLPLALLLALAGFLTSRGWNKITHDASLVHASGIPSHAPDPALLSSFLSAASEHEEAGLTLKGLAAVHALRERDLPHQLSSLHEQVALGECALGWLVMHNPITGVIDLDTLEQWFGEERLPHGWWESKRPAKEVGLIQARKTAGKVQHMAKEQ